MVMYIPLAPVSMISVSLGLILGGEGGVTYRSR